MGTTVHCESYLPGYYHPMRDISEDSNSCGWPLYYGDKSLSNGQCCDGFLPTEMVDSYSGYEKDLVKRTMLEHEAIFKNQVYELHRLYRIQRNLMDEIKRKELNKNQNQAAILLSSGPLESQITSKNANKWHMPSFLLPNSVCGRPLVSGSCSQGFTLPSQNGVSSKDVEVIEVRPLKVRRKMIDLQLPADEYIDTEEIGETQDPLNSLPNGNHESENRTGENLCLEGEVVSNQGGSLRSDLGLRSSNNFGDLNEPARCQETEPVGSSKDIYFKSLCGRNSIHVRDLRLEENKSQTRRQVLGAGLDKSTLKSVCQSFQSDKLHLSSQCLQVLSNNGPEPQGYPSIDRSKVIFSKEKTVRDLEVSARNLEVSSDSHVESSVASNAPSSYSHRPDFVKPWKQLLSSWENPSCSLGQKSVSVQAHPFFISSETLNGSNTRARATRPGLYGDRWYPDSNSRANPSYESRCLDQSGFYHGCSSGSKEAPSNFPAISFNHLNSRNDNNAATEHIKNHGATNFYKDIKSLDKKIRGDISFNGALPNGSVNGALTQQGLESLQVERNAEEHLAALPWLKAKPACKSEMTNGNLDLNAIDLNVSNSSLNQVADKKDSEKGLNHMFFHQSLKSVSCSNRKVLGFPIFDKPSGCKEERSSLTFQSEENKVEKRELDINLPCDPAVFVSYQHSAEVLVIEKGADKKGDSFRHQIDLNLCVSGDEDSFESLTPRATTKVTPWIDLEAPAAPETAEDNVCEEKSSEEADGEPLGQPKGKDGNLMDEIIEAAAEAIIAISLSSHHSHLDEAASCLKETSGKNPLRWFAETIYSCGSDLDKKLEAFSESRDNEDYCKECSSEGFEYFESMTLKLPEMKEEDYMPKPLVPENLKLEETGQTLIQNRPRRGQARRGRQRRDFQRDILPGLASLSRHEVTEDLQTFGGLMRATGYSWNSGLTRRISNRNCSNRGRPRKVNSNNNTSQACPLLVQQQQRSNSIEVVNLEDRSFTGWGKTTRRPRRQRCPAGNPPAAILTQFQG